MFKGIVPPPVMMIGFILVIGLGPSEISENFLKEDNEGMKNPHSFSSLIF